MPLEKKEIEDNEDPDQKFTAFANRGNSDFKWQRARNVLGVLEVYSEPILKPREDLKPRRVKGRETAFEEALKAWEKEKLRQDLIEALENLPVETCCCGFMEDNDSTKKQLVKLLNDFWAKKASKKLQRHGFKVDAFLWNWQNASGKAETNIILIRFYMVASYGLRAASRSGGFDVSERTEEVYNNDFTGNTQRSKSADMTLDDKSDHLTRSEKRSKSVDMVFNDKSGEKIYDA